MVRHSIPAQSSFVCSILGFFVLFLLGRRENCVWIFGLLGWDWIRFGRNFGLLLGILVVFVGILVMKRLFLDS
jgi:hypothetical protein